MGQVELAKLLMFIPIITGVLSLALPLSGIIWAFCAITGVSKKGLLGLFATGAVSLAAFVVIGIPITFYSGLLWLGEHAPRG